MRLTSARYLLLLPAILVSLLRFASGAPFPQTAGATKSQAIPHDYGLPIVSLKLSDEETFVARIENQDEDGDTLFPDTAENKEVERIFARITFSKPTTPPPLPASRSAPLSLPQGPAPRPRPIQPPPPRPNTPPRPDPPKPEPGARPIPLEERPGQCPGKGDEPKSMDTYEHAGITQLNRYETIARSAQPDTLIVQTEEDVAKYDKNRAFLDIRKDKAYDCVEEWMRMDHRPELKVLKNFRSSEVGFDIKSANSLNQITVNVKDNPGKTINRGTYDKEGRFIIYQDAFKENNEASGAQKIPLNEMGMQNFKFTAGDETKNFKAAFLMDVQNMEFWAITRQNYNDLKQPFSQVLTFQRGTPQFDRYMGSPNLNSKFYSLANHHNAISNKIPTKVIVIPKQAENSDGKLTAAVIFEDS